MFLFVSLSGSFSGGPSPEIIYICDMTHDLWEDGEAIYLTTHDHNGGGRDGIPPLPPPPPPKRPQVRLWAFTHIEVYYIYL